MLSIEFFPPRLKRQRTGEAIHEFILIQRGHK